MLTFSAPDHWSQQLYLCSLRHGHDLIHHLIHGLLADLPATLRTMRDTDTRIQQTKVIIDLCHRSDRRTRIAVR